MIWETYLATNSDNFVLFSFNQLVEHFSCQNWCSIVLALHDTWDQQVVGN